MAKSTKAEIDTRVTTIAKLLLQRTPRLSIVQFGAKEWGVSNRAIDKYIAKARKRMVEKNKVSFEQARAEHIEIQKQLYMAAQKAEKLELCHEINRDIAKIEGLYVDRVEHSGSIGLYRDMSAEERQVRILELERKRLESKEGNGE